MISAEGEDPRKAFPCVEALAGGGVHQEGLHGESIVLGEDLVSGSTSELDDERVPPASCKAQKEMESRLTTPHRASPPGAYLKRTGASLDST